MGAALAELFAFNDLDVVLADQTPALVEKGLARVRGIVDDLVGFHAGRADREIERLAGLGVVLTDAQAGTVRSALKPKVSRERGEAIVARVRPAATWDAFREVDLVIEAVFEQEAAKRAVLERLDSLLPEGTVIGSNTSSLSVTRLARGLMHARETLVTHFFNPPGTLPLVEVAAAYETRDDVVDGVVEFLQGLRNHRSPLVPVRVRESPAFVVNRVLLPVLNEACFLLEEGVASSRDIDLAMKAGAGFPMGPFELADMIGLDVALEVSETLRRETGDPKYRPSLVLKRLVDAGHLGRKTGRGFYEYV